MNIDKTLNKLFATTTEPMLGLTIDQLGIKTSYTIEGQHINIKLEAGFPTKFIEVSLVEKLKEACEQALSGYQINFDLISFIRAHRTQLPGKGLRNVKNTIAIASGKGGVGKSTLAVNLAIALARAGARVGLLDADIYGPSIPLMLGKTAAVQIKDERYLPVSAYGIQAMSIGYLTDSEQALIWRGPMLAKSLIQMLDITAWDELDYLIIDLPPGTGDIQLSLVQKIPLTAAVVVTTPQNIATLDAQKAIKMFERTHIDVLGLVENMSLHQCSQCGHQETIFGSGGGEKLAKHFKVDLLGQLPLNKLIQDHCDQGKPTAAQTEQALALPFIQTALRVAIALAKKPLNYADKFPEIVVES